MQVAHRDVESETFDIATRERGTARAISWNMIESLQVTLKEVPWPSALEDRIREQADKLGRFHPDPMSLRVVVACPHQHHRGGKRYQASLVARVRGHELVVNRAPDAHHAYVDPYVAIHDAFHSMRRVLMEHVRVRRGDVKTHGSTPHGVVVSLFPEDAYGVISTSENRDLPFRADSVVNGTFEAVNVGARVRYVEVEGDRGPEATSVFVVK